MPSVEVDGVRVPMTVAGHLGLELCNTRAGWSEPEPKEYLLSYEHLAVWARHSGLTATVPRVAETKGAAIVKRAIAFRQAYYDAIVEGRPDWAALSAETRRLGIGLAPAADGTLARFDPGDDEESPLRAAVFGAVEVLTSPMSLGVRACPGVGCGWVFYDPRGRRRWCLMAVCGNRAKAARHAALLRDQEPRTRSK
jgi:predicted RNA-binding Zn ribbon-like protein